MLWVQAGGCEGSLGLGVLTDIPFVTDSCKGRCSEGFNKDRKCQCDELCSYYQSCCGDYIAECKPQGTFPRD